MVGLMVAFGPYSVLPVESVARGVIESCQRGPAHRGSVDFNLIRLTDGKLLKVISERCHKGSDVRVVKRRGILLFNSYYEVLSANEEG